MVTRADVAKAAGVSPSTVTYVLTGARPTSRATKDRVAAAIAELGYVPDARAANLASRSLRTIGLHLFAEAHGVDENAADYLRGMREAAQDRGLSVVMPLMDNEDPDAFRRVLKGAAVDAFVFMEAVKDDWRERVLLEEGIPAVVLGSTMRSDGLPWVETDFAAVGQMAIYGARERGAKSVIAVMHGDHRPDTERTSSAIMGGLRAGAELFGGDLELHILRLPTRASAGILAAQTLQRSLCEGAAVLVGDNAPAIEAAIGLSAENGIEAVRDYGVAILAGSGYFGEHAQWRISEFTPNRYQMGRTCIDLVCDYYENGREAVESQLFAPSLHDFGTF